MEASYVGLMIYIILAVCFLCTPIKKKKEDEENIEDVIIVTPTTLIPKLTESYLTLDNYIGQEDMIEYLQGHIDEAYRLSEPLPHMLLSGHGGLGKSTLVRAVAHEIGGNFIELMPANLSNSTALFSVLFQKECPHCLHLNPYSSKKCLNIDCRQSIAIYFKPHNLLEDKDTIFIEECHGLNRKVEECLYSAMQDKYIALEYDGINQQVSIPDITIAGATTRAGDLEKPFRDRFILSIHLEHYSIENMKTITRMYAESKGLKVSTEALRLIAAISHGIPRIAKKYIKDTSTISRDIREQDVKKILQLLSIDEIGLNKNQQKTLKYVLMRMQAMKNGGAGATAIASSIGVSSDEYLDIIEGPLMYHGLLFQGSKGRRLTDKALDMYFTEDEKTKIRI